MKNRPLPEKQAKKTGKQENLQKKTGKNRKTGSVGTLPLASIYLKTSLQSH